MLSSPCYEIYVKCEWKHQKLDDLMNYKFLYPICIQRRKCRLEISGTKYGFMV